MAEQQQLNIDDELKALVAEVLEMDPAEIDPEANFVKDLGMDSMMALEILAGIEKKYQIVIPEELLPQFVNLKETIRIVKEQMQKK